MRTILKLFIALLFWGFARPSLVSAQSLLDLKSTRRDVLYAQSDFLRNVDESWLAPLSSIRTSSYGALDLTTPVPAIPNTPPPRSSGSSENPVNSQDAQARSENRIHWGPAIRESLLYTGIMHTFNIATEAGTRDTLNGKWFDDYIASVGELRGWSDSDHFMAPYVGHPIEGSVFGFIERQNDPMYRAVQFGDGRGYWVSMLRSMAYSAVWHTQWKIGPISEASIGNVMLHASPGFITLVDTPTLGFCTMLGEDAADRYLITGLENRTANRAMIMLARSFLNPGRTFANLMAFKYPWDRTTRMGLFGENYVIRKQLIEDYKGGAGEKPFVFVKTRGCPPASNSPTRIPKKRISNSRHFRTSNLSWAVVPASGEVAPARRASIRSGKWLPK